jgi:glycosyltransferase involved in cell wall biosynthesis
MASPEIRAFEIARALAGDLDVTLYAPGGPTGDLGDVRPVASPPSPGDLARELEWFDAVVAQRLPPLTLKHLARTSTRLVYDLYTPVLGELLAAGFDDPAGRRLADAEIHSQRLALVTADAFVCPGQRHRDYWLGALGALGRVDRATYEADPALLNLIDVVPFGVSERPPSRGGRPLREVFPAIGADDRIVLWAGSIAWTDPEIVIRAVAAIAERRPDVKLVFVGVDPANGPRPEPVIRARDLAASLGALDRAVFFFAGRHPYDDRGAYLLEAHIGVSAFHDLLEARLAHRARLLDYFWAGLPVVTTHTDELGEIVAQRELGRAVAAGDVAGFTAALSELLDDREAYRRASENVAAFQRDLTWPRVVEPLRRMVSDEGVRATRGIASRAVALEELIARRRSSWARRGLRGTLSCLAGRQ